jgi:hypothetical protein
VKLLRYSGPATDSRACTACACDSPTGIDCSQEKVLFFSDACDSKTTDLSPPVSCAGNLSNDRPPTHVQLDKTPQASGGSCAPSGGLPTGAVVASGATTLCCAP